MAAPSTPIVKTAKPNVLPLGADVWGAQRVTVTKFTVGAKYYASSGIPLTPKDLGLANAHWVQITPEVPGTTSYVFQYDYTNKLIRVYQGPTSAGALPQVTDSDTAFTPFTVRVLAVGV